MTIPDGLPYGGALDAVRRIEGALTERDAARDTADDQLTLAHAEAEQLLAAARAAGERAGEARRAELLAEGEAKVRAVRRRGQAQVEWLDVRVSDSREALLAELMALLIPEEA